MQSTDAPTIISERKEQTSDLQATLAISNVEALRGTLRNLALPDGRRVSVTVPAGAYDGQLIRLEGQAIPSSTGKAGALLIRLAITPSVDNPVVPTSDGATITSLSRSPRQFNVSPRGSSKGMMILLICLALVVIVGSVGFAFFYVTTISRQATTNANGTALAQSTATALAHVGTGTPANTALTPSTSQDPYTHAGTLALNDPLQDNNQNVGWMTGTNQNNATCAFGNGAYQASQPLDGNFHACFALATDFSNFVFEVQMTIVSGYSGGIIFRANQANSTFYYFRAGQDGSYDLRVYVDKLIDHSHPLVSGSSPAIHAGYNQPNLIAVVARGSLLELYANQQPIITVNDSTYSHGQIGIVAYNQGGLATAVYRNARVWTL